MMTAPWCKTENVKRIEEFGREYYLLQEAFVKMAHCIAYYTFTSIINYCFKS